MREETTFPHSFPHSVLSSPLEQIYLGFPRSPFNLKSFCQIRERAIEIRRGIKNTSFSLVISGQVFTRLPWFQGSHNDRFVRNVGFFQVAVCGAAMYRSDSPPPRCHQPTHDDNHGGGGDGDKHDGGGGNNSSKNWLIVPIGSNG